MIRTTFTAVVIGLGLLVSVAWYTNNKLVEATNMVSHSLVVLTTLEKITSDMAQAESAQRGYLLLQLPRLLVERDRKRDAAHAGIRLIEQLIADESEQRRHIDLLKGLFLQRFAAAAATQRSLDSMSPEAITVYFAKGAFLSAKLRDVTEDIKAEENWLLTRRNADKTLRLQIARGSFILLIASLIIILLFLTKRIQRDIGLQEQADNALRLAHDELETRVQQRTAELETVNASLKVEIVDHEEVEKALQESQYLLHKLAFHDESIREDERKRIAREIHDELGQRLLVLRIDVTLLQTRSSAPHALFAEKISAVLEDIATIMGSVRLIINDLRPAVLDLGLYAAIKWQLKQFQLKTGITCVLAASSQEVELIDSGATSLFRILQESLTNVGRHSQATRVVVDLNTDGNNVLMRVSDNGIGTASGYNAKKDSFGLMGMQERISSLGGWVGIVTAQGRGFTITVSIPNHVGMVSEKEIT